MTSPSAETLLRTGIAAYKTGDKERATACFREALTIDPRNEHAWIWMAAVMDKDDARRFCLERALAINPNNEAARRYLDKMAVQGAVAVTGANAPPRENHPSDRPHPSQPAAVAEISSPTRTIDPTIRVGTPISSSPAPAAHAPASASAMSSYQSGALHNTPPTHALASAAAAPTAALPAQPAQGSAEPVWYYVHKNQKIGPVQEHVIQQLVSTGVISRKSLVWTHGMAQWTPLESTLLARLMTPSSGHATATARPSPAAVSSHRSGAADRQPWYYSRGCLILTFIFLTPVWVLMILMDWKRQGWGVRILASVIGFVYVTWLGATMLTAALSPPSPAAETRTSAVEAPRTTPSPTPTTAPAPARVGLGVTREQVEAFYRDAGFRFVEGEPYDGQDTTQAKEYWKYIRHDVAISGPDENILCIRTSVFASSDLDFDNIDTTPSIAFLFSGIAIADPDWWEDDGREWVQRTVVEWERAMAVGGMFSSQMDIDDTRRVSFSAVSTLEGAFIMVEIEVREELWPE